MGSFLKAYSSSIAGWDFNLSDSNLVKGIQVHEKFLDYASFSNDNATESSKKQENNPGCRNKSTDAVLNYINQVLLDDDLENEPCMIENSILEAAEKSFCDVLYNDLNNMGNAAYNCSQRNTNSNGLFAIVNDQQKSKSSICSCHHSKVVKGEPNCLVRTRSLNSEDIEFMQGRSNKHVAVCPEESILGEMFDRLLSLYSIEKDSKVFSDLSSSKEPAKKSLSRREVNEMRKLLMRCMKSMLDSEDDNASNATKLLKVIRSHACVSGDGTQRLAHYFANGLEARLAGGVNGNHGTMNPQADLWKAFKLYLTAFPFMETSYFYANQMIMTLAEKQETSTLHIIHFGIMHGLQWPAFIQSLSRRPGGPPKLRITGIDFPHDGFRLDAMMEGTKRRLVSICERFNVPFEYNGFVKNWENITLNDFKIEKNEVVVVNCLCQLMYLLDDTVVEKSPRDIVLRLIKRVNPELFVHVIVNGAYNLPIFVSRFREALNHYSTLFNMFDVVLARDNSSRKVFEGEIWGREITNIIACEGKERIERPETYKQWQLRSIRAGFKQLPLNEEIVKKVRDRMKSCYHKDFLLDEAGDWLLNGWRGRARFALSCWEPADKHSKKDANNTCYHQV